MQWNSPLSKMYKHSKSFSFFFRFLTAALQKNGHNSFIFCPTKCHLVQHVILAHMIYHVTTKWLLVFLNRFFIFRTRRSCIYFIAPYCLSSSVKLFIYSFVAHSRNCFMYRNCLHGLACGQRCSWKMLAQTNKRNFICISMFSI